MSEIRLETELELLPLSRRTRSILSATDYRMAAELMRTQGKPLRQDMLPHCDPQSWREIRTCLAVLEAKGMAAGEAAADQKSTSMRIVSP